MKSIREISEIKKSEYESEYKKWCEETGKIFNGFSSKIMACEDIKYCNTVSELDFLIRMYEGKHISTMEKFGISGWNFAKNVAIGIKEEYLKELIYETKSTQLL